MLKSISPYDLQCIDHTSLHNSFQKKIYSAFQSKSLTVYTKTCT